MTEFNARNSHPNEKKPLQCSVSILQGKIPSEKDTGTSVFVNLGIIIYNTFFPYEIVVLMVIYGIQYCSSELHRATNFTCMLFL
ncbi:hypothetical protein SLEP1_g42588 [Rubroshorea leprosula]|uniref:Uncharacterized protein n=1 Tax=Rubroshorea leprosula TaxID=152421 RepID=A0AAV5LAF7_9ROSI|nr:hypothetical protein SLEP1_g42588 [Rubroshorea leprosula]